MCVRRKTSCEAEVWRVTTHRSVDVIKTNSTALNLFNSTVASVILRCLDLPTDFLEFAAKLNRVIRG